MAARAKIKTMLLLFNKDEGTSDYWKMFLNLDLTLYNAYSSNELPTNENLNAIFLIPSIYL